MRIRTRFALVAGLLTSLFVAALGIGQPPPVEPLAATSLPQQILAFLSNQSIAATAGLIATIIFKFFPAFRNLTNVWLPVVGALTAWLVNVLSPTPAFAGFFGDLGRLAAGPVLAIVNMGIQKLVWEGMLRGPTSYHWAKPLPDNPIPPSQRVPTPR